MSPASSEGVSTISPVDVWADVVGQERAVQRLQAAASSPVHAYLLVGPEGAGKRSAARAFAATILAEGASPEETERHQRLALAEQHPDLRVVEPQGATVRREEAEAIVRHATRSPSEGRRKVVVGIGLQSIEDAAIGLMLKTIEEPPASTVFVFLATEVVPELVTIASRCNVIELHPVTPAAVAARLVAEGIDPGRAQAVAAAARGDLRRARLLASDERVAVRHRALLELPGRLDGTGARAAELAAEIKALIDDAQEPLDQRQAAEAAEIDERIERYGLRGSGKKELEDRHKREVRRHRTAELRFAFATLAGVYRDALPTAHRPEQLIAACRRIDDAAIALERYPNESLLLQALLARLPAV
jgi:DNA polymerase III subunit delta'